MNSNQRFPRTVRKKLNEDNNKQAPQLIFCQLHSQGLVITLGQIGYCTVST